MQNENTSLKPESQQRLEQLAHHHPEILELVAEVAVLRAKVVSLKPENPESQPQTSKKSK